MALFSILISPLNAFPWVINGLVEAWVSTKRIQAFLKLSELDSDQYYSSMQDVMDNTADDDDRVSNSSPESDSQHRQITKKTETAVATRTTEVPVHVHVHAAAPQDGSGPEPSTSEGSCPVEEVHVEGEVRSQSDKVAVEDGGNLLQLNAALVERRASVGRGRQRRRNRIIVVRNGHFTWSRKDRERVAEPNDSESRGKNKKRTVENRSEPSVESKEKTADSAKVVAPVEWMLSDLNFTIYSVHIFMSTHCCYQYTFSIFLRHECLS